MLISRGLVQGFRDPFDAGLAAVARCGGSCGPEFVAQILRVPTAGIVYAASNLGELNLYLIRKTTRLVATTQGTFPSRSTSKTLLAYPPGGCIMAQITANAPQAWKNTRIVDQTSTGSFYGVISGGKIVDSVSVFALVSYFSSGRRIRLQWRAEKTARGIDSEAGVHSGEVYGFEEPRADASLCMPMHGSPSSVASAVRLAHGILIRFSKLFNFSLRS